METIPCAMSPDGRLFAVHCSINTELSFMDTAILVVESACHSGWREMVIPQLYGGGTFQVQLPINLTERDSRYKGYNVRLPISAITEPT